MNDAPESTDLTGKLLIAMPGMGDPRFDQSVIFLCAHSAEGAMGLIVNKPVPDLKMDDLLDQLEIPRGSGSRGIFAHFGGPVERERGFVLHSGDYDATGATMRVNAAYGMTATRDILAAITDGNGPAVSLLMLGYAGWGPGQLEQEIVHNGWLVSDATTEVVFEAQTATKWQAALKTLGVDPISLSATGGRA
ncbi:MAG: YqgE/AlgH family protein [Marinosulfonomonas sp.]|nr:YqgE/AlgH family protein [Marinosulfonomonas sp.]